MGCYNTILINCPYCGYTNCQQTKSGDCSFTTVDIRKAKLEDIAGLDKEFNCHKCNKELTITIQSIINIS